MKTKLTGAMLFLTSFVVFAQTPEQVYEKPLKEVLNDIQIRYGVKLVYEDKIIQNKTVSFADWKLYNDVEATLDNVLRPLDLRYTKKDGNLYELKAWEYFRKSDEEGRLSLEKLWISCPTLDKWETRKTEVKQNILEKMGLFPLPVRNPLNPIRSNFRTHDGYTAENVALEIVPGVYLSGTLYKPAKIAGKAPAMLCPHGHFYNNVDKSIPNERGRYRPDQQNRCAMLARMGVIVFSYDMFAWGESCLQVNAKEHRTGFALTMQTWGSMRVIDFLLSMNEVDPSRIGITGASGGGTQTFLAAALDERITLSVPTVMVSSHFYGGCPCESGLPIHQLDNGKLPTNNAEIAALFAPKPLLVISDGSDWTSTVPQIELPYLKKVYGLYGKSENVENAHLAQEGHDYGFSKRIAMYDFVARHFGLNANRIKGKNGQFDESKVTIEPATEMYVFRTDNPFPKTAAQGIEQIKAAFLKCKSK